MFKKNPMRLDEECLNIYPKVITLGLGLLSSYSALSMSFCGTTAQNRAREGKVLLHQEFACLCHQQIPQSSSSAGRICNMNPVKACASMCNRTCLLQAEHQQASQSGRSWAIQVFGKLLCSCQGSCGRHKIRQLIRALYSVL
jgi:hypothetical protein